MKDKGGASVFRRVGSVSKKLAGHLEQIGIKNRTTTMQKSALLESAHILRKVCYWNKLSPKQGTRGEQHR